MFFEPARINLSVLPALSSACSTYAGKYGERSRCDQRHGARMAVVPGLHCQGHDDCEEDRQAFRNTNSSHIVVSFVRTTVFSILPFLRKKCDASPFSHYEKGAESQRTPHLTLLNRFYQKPGSTPASTYACLKPPISLIIWYLRTNKKALELFKLQRLYYGDPGAIRTRDTCLRRAVLYPLSYGAV